MTYADTQRDDVITQASTAAAAGRTNLQEGVSGGGGAASKNAAKRARKKAAAAAAGGTPDGADVEGADVDDEVPTVEATTSGKEAATSNELYQELKHSPGEGRGHPQSLGSNSNLHLYGRSFAASTGSLLPQPHSVHHSSTPHLLGNSHVGIYVSRK